MRHDEYAEHVIDFTGEMTQVTSAKNHDYSVNDDTMSNFKEIGRLLGISPRLVWSVLWMKHVTAVVNHMAQGKSLKSETIHGRFIDLANYSVLGDALDDDLKSETGPHKSSPENAFPQNACIEYMFYIDEQLKRLSRHVGPGSGMDHEFQAMRARTKAFLEKFPRDQHGMQEACGPVSRGPVDVHDESPSNGTVRESDDGFDASPHSQDVASRDSDSRDAEFRRDRPRARKSTDSHGRRREE